MSEITNLLSAVEFISSALRLINEDAREQALRDNFTSYLRKIFPEEPNWVKYHIHSANSPLHIVRRETVTVGFVDNLVGLTAIEYEADISTKAGFESGFEQIKEYCAALINAGNTADYVLGILSDTVRWRVYSVKVGQNTTPITKDDIKLDQIDSLDLRVATEQSATALIEFLCHYLGRRESRMLSASSISSDLGFESIFCHRHLESIRDLVDRAFLEKEEYAILIQNLWCNFVTYLRSEGTPEAFNKTDYTDEFYILTLAKLICANVLQKKALLSDDLELKDILSGRFFKHKGLSNLVEYDYFGWLNEPPYLDSLLPIAKLIQNDLLAYNFQQLFQEDLFGQMMAQLANRSQRVLLGQEWTPSWLAKALVSKALSCLPNGVEPCFIDMCCGSGTIVVEMVKSVIVKLRQSGRQEEQGILLKNVRQAITGFDIDPLAVMLSKIAWVLAVRDLLEPFGNHEITIPIYHADSLFAITPLSNRVQEEEGEEFHDLNVAGTKIKIPRFLLTAHSRLIFDSLLDFAYQLALGSLDSEAVNLNDEVINATITQVCHDSNTMLNTTQVNSVKSFLNELIQVIHKLAREGRNGIWIFILRNSYRPGLVAGQFNGLVSNPPWLALSKIANNPYHGILTSKAERYNIKPPGASHPHIELATIFLLHAVDRYLSSGASIGCIVPETVLNGHHHNPFRKGDYISGPRSVALAINEIWKVEAGTFKNLAAVLFGKKEHSVTALNFIPGKLVGRNIEQPLKFYPNKQGNRLIWSTNEPQQSNISSGFFEPAEFRQGADIMPRTLFLVEVEPVMDDPSVPRSRISSINPRGPLAFAIADAKKQKAFRLSPAVVSNDFIFDILTSNLLLPFHLGNPLKSFLPIRKDPTERWEYVDPTLLLGLDRNAHRTIEQIDRAIKNEEPGKSIMDLIDCRHKLTQQIIPSSGYLVVTGAGGERPCSAFISLCPGNSNKLIIDQTLYWAQVPDDDEAVYLTGLFNSNSIIEVIKDFIPKGAFGGRHLHKLPFGVTPRYNPFDVAHQEVVVKTRLLMGEFRQIANHPIAGETIFDPNRGSLQARRLRIKKYLIELPAYADYEEACRNLYGV